MFIYAFPLVQALSPSLTPLFCAFPLNLTLSRKNFVKNDRLIFSVISWGSVTRVNEVSDSKLIHHLLINSINNSFFINDNTFY